MRKSILLFVYIILGIIAYSKVVSLFFLSDDFLLVYSVKTHGPFGVWSNSSWFFVRPVISLVLFIDYKLWKLNPSGYHLTNIVFHSVNSFLVFMIILLLLEKYSTRIKTTMLAFFSGLLFLVMPCHTEAVSWISGRCDVIATFLFLLAFYFYLYYKKNHIRIYLLLSFLFYIIAILAKESVIIYPFLILLYEFYNYPYKKDNKPPHLHIFILPLLYFLLTVFYIPFRYLMLGKIIGGYGVGCHLNFNPALIFNNLVLYSMRSFLFPYFFPKVVFVVICVGVIFIILKNKDWLFRIRILSFFMVAFFISLIPIINLGTWTGDTQGERFIYLPTVFSSVLIILAINFLLANTKYSIFFIFCLIFLCQISLGNINKNWNTAGEICKNILNSLDMTEEANRLCIINLPDNIHGAYIYRNGIKEAVYLFNKGNSFSDICVCLYHNIFDKNDKVIVGKMPQPNTYIVSLVNKMTFFFPVNMFGRTQSECIVDKPVISNSMNNSFSIISLKENYKLLFYSEGRMFKF